MQLFFFITKMTKSTKTLQANQSCIAEELTLKHRLQSLTLKHRLQSPTKKNASTTNLPFALVSTAWVYTLDPGCNPDDGYS